MASVKCEHSATITDLRRKHEEEPRESSECLVALELTLSNLQTALLEKDDKLKEAPAVKSQLRAEKARLEEKIGNLRKCVIELQCQDELRLFEKTTHLRQDDKLKQAAVVESQLRTENAVLAEKVRSFCTLVFELQNQIAQKELKNADLKTALQEQDDKLKRASAVESKLRTENARLEAKCVGLCERVDELQQQNAEANLQLADLKTILLRRDDALKRASVVEAQLLREVSNIGQSRAMLVCKLQQNAVEHQDELANSTVVISQLQEDLADLNGRINDLQRQNEKQKTEIERLKACSICFVEYSEDKYRQALLPCGHSSYCCECVAHIEAVEQRQAIVAANETARFLRRPLPNPSQVPFDPKCPSCRSVFTDKQRIYE